MNNRGVSMENWRKAIEDVITPTTGRWGMAVAHLGTDRELAWNRDDQFPAASLIKVPIMYEIMRQAAEGNLSLEERLTATDRDKTGGAGILKELNDGLSLTIRELVTLMIIISDNTATNMLIDFIGMDAVNRTMNGLGLSSTVLRRRMMDDAAARTGRENLTSAADMAHLLQVLYVGRKLPLEYHDLMLDILKRQQVRDKLPFYLPEETVVAHKTGTLAGVEHDAGILYLPGGDYLAVVLMADLAYNQEGIMTIAHVGRIIYELARQDKNLTARED